MWRLPAPAEDVYRILADLRSYPSWWPDVRQVITVGPEEYRVAVSALLPYTLDFVVRRAVVDPDAGVIEGSMRGDLDGFSRWTVAEAPGGAVATFDEEVIARRRLLTVLGPVARPAFVANHGLMMRRGRRCLRLVLVGFRLGRSESGTEEAV